ncbi:MAG: diguanylate cyclase domain-containing protein [Pseudomonadota bacterium]
MKTGIATRLALLLACVGMLAAGLTGYYAHAISRDLLIESAKREMLTSTQVLARRIALTREEVSRNLQILAGHPAALAVLRSPDDEAEAELATLFRLMMGSHRPYFAIRLIAAADHGLERVRVDRDNDRLVRVTGDDLQEKGHYSYVYDTLRVPAGNAYMSRIAINHEQGAHAGLEQPTVQLATPVVDADGQAWGVIVISVDLNGMFSLLAADLPKDFQLYFVNREGDYLIHPDPTRAFGFDQGRRFLVQEEFPSLRPLVDGTLDQALIETAGGTQADRPLVAAFIARPVLVSSEETRMILGLARPLAAIQASAERLGEAMLGSVAVICLACVLLAVAVARAVTRPINAVSTAAQRFAEGQRGEDLPLERRDEIGVLARAFADMQDQLHRQLAELEQRRGELEHQARHDPLTGLPNRALFADRVAQALAAARREHAKLALMFIDLDRLKPINDQLGHAVGDQVIEAVAQRMRGVIRESDTAARIGGDEFVVLLPHVQTAEDALTVADKIRQAVAEPLNLDTRTLHITASLGIALYPDHGDSLIALSGRADGAMYRIKQAGGDAIALAGSESPVT